MVAQLPNVSDDLLWEIVRNNNSFLVSRRKHAKVQFSRDPLNLLNVNSRKHAGFVNSKAVGVAAKKDGGLVLLNKNKKTGAAYGVRKTTLSRSARNSYKAIAGHTARNGYRADLREVAIQRASNLTRSQRTKKATPEKKLRGKQAEKAAAASA